MPRFTHRPAVRLSLELLAVLLTACAFYWLVALSFLAF